MMRGHDMKTTAWLQRLPHLDIRAKNQASEPALLTAAHISREIPLMFAITKSPAPKDGPPVMRLYSELNIAKGTS